MTTLLILFLLRKFKARERLAGLVERLLHHRNKPVAALP